MKTSVLKEVIASILGPLQYEPRNGYKDSTVSGGFSAFALKKLSQLRSVDLEPSEWRNLEKLKIALESYQEHPSKESYEIVSTLLGGQEMMVSTRETREVPLDLARKDLLKPIQFIKGIGPKRALLFQKLGIHCLLDLFYFFPRDYLDRSRIVPMNQAKVGEYQTFLGPIQDVKEFQKGSLSILNVIVYDRSGILALTFFNQKYLFKLFTENKGKKIIFSGKIQYSFNRFSVDSPEFEFVEEERETIHAGRIVPIYRLTAGMNGKSIRNLIKNQLDEFSGSIYDFIPCELLKNMDLPSRSKAIKNLHFPESAKDLELARKRIVFEEFLLGQYRLFKKKEIQQSQMGSIISTDPAQLDKFLTSLPFTLTKSQRTALDEILLDMQSGKSMNRLLHGDVGSGKTIIATSLFYVAALQQVQSAFMAPTEILARQSYQVVAKYLTPFQMKADLLISEMKEKDKKKVIEKLYSGETNVVVGTHALIQDNVLFQSLGLVIVDEQHRFGVMQRLLLKNKGFLPHVLVMSATPIPRSVAMTRYGDLELSVINEMPGGERKVKTKIVDTLHLPQIYDFMAKEIQGGAKVYIVCPLVEESEKIEAADSIQKAEEMKKIFPQFNVLLLHGRMTSQEKEQIMQAFREPSGHILVSTTVIEVGIDIPEASIIYIENAERFGLAQLHQLRGRVGRKSQQSYCFLYVASREGKNRLAIMEKTNSGFLIAEEDLAQRGPGELFGEKQSGFLSISLVDMEKDLPLLENAKKMIPTLLQKKEWESKIIQEIDFRRNNVTEKEMMTIG